MLAWSRGAAEDEDRVDDTSAIIGTASMAGAGFSCAPLSTDVDNLNIPGGRLVPRLRPDSVMVTDVPLVIVAPVVMMIAVLVDVDAEAPPVQDGTLHVTVAEPRK